MDWLVLHAVGASDVGLERKAHVALSPADLRLLQLRADAVGAQPRLVNDADYAAWLGPGCGFTSPTASPPLPSLLRWISNPDNDSGAQGPPHVRIHLLYTEPTPIKSSPEWGTQRISAALASALGTLSSADGIAFGCQIDVHQTEVSITDPDFTLEALGQPIAAAQREGRRAAFEFRHGSTRIALSIVSALMESNIEWRGLTMSAQEGLLEELVFTPRPIERDVAAWAVRMGLGNIDVTVFDPAERPAVEAVNRAAQTLTRRDSFDDLTLARYATQTALRRGDSVSGVGVRRWLEVENAARSLTGADATLIENKSQSIKDKAKEASHEFTEINMGPSRGEENTTLEKLFAPTAYLPPGCETWPDSLPALTLPPGGRIAAIAPIASLWHIKALLGEDRGESAVRIKHLRAALKQVVATGPAGRIVPTTLVAVLGCDHVAGDSCDVQRELEPVLAEIVPPEAYLTCEFVHAADSIGETSAAVAGFLESRRGQFAGLVHLPFGRTRIALGSYLAASAHARNQALPFAVDVTPTDRPRNQPVFHPIGLGPQSWPLLAQAAWQALQSGFSFETAIRLLRLAGRPGKGPADRLRSLRDWLHDHAPTATKRSTMTQEEALRMAVRRLAVLTALRCSLAIKPGSATDDLFAHVMAESFNSRLDEAYGLRSGTPRHTAITALVDYRNRLAFNHPRGDDPRTLDEVLSAALAATADLAEGAAPFVGETTAVIGDLRRVAEEAGVARDSLTA